jgi:hypothetical protein
MEGQGLAGRDNPRASPSDRTGFTRSIPPEAPGQRYYTRWRVVTRERLDPQRWT